ncbi:MAG: hypothetical protein IT340_04410 [Chloroflexi bacterium]|nr:hypothetical protein [Chloroflexota bacterium]
MAAHDQRHWPLPPRSALADLIAGGGALLLIAVVAGLIYRPLLQPAAPDLTPWSSDGLGHLLKARYLLAQVGQGDWYPTLFPGWYLGLELFRAYPPLPYYLLAALTAIADTPEAAAGWFIVLCAGAGAASWLLYRRWLGGAALLGGLLFLLLPDNIRVAFAEGNLPRLLVTALLPLTLYLVLRGLGDDGHRGHRLGLALCCGLMVITHPMLAGINAAVAGAIILLAVVSRQARPGPAGATLAAIVLGLALSGWWLVPGLGGGLIDIDASAMAEALASVPVEQYLNPLVRAGNPETVYVGATLIALAVAVAVLPPAGDLWPRLLAIVGLATLAISTPAGYQVFRALPLSHLLWPIRFLGAASLLLLLAVLWRLPQLRRWPAVASIATVVALMADFGGSLGLIHLRPADTQVTAIATAMAATPGWRAATLDLSRLGSRASYTLAVTGQREQVYGWAYQGARTARTVAALNEAVEAGHRAYLADRLDLLGVDDVVLLTDLPEAAAIETALQARGLVATQRQDGLAWLHRDGQPRAARLDQRALGIGRGARNLSFLFPQIVIGASDRLDDYPLTELLRYDRVVLSGFSWRDRARAEEMTRQLAQAGVRVVIDLTGATPDPWARLPRFLDVWGEQISLTSGVLPVTGAGTPMMLHDVGVVGAPWTTHTLQGQIAPTVTTTYFGEPATVIGRQPVGPSDIWFIGLNLPYHAVLTRDSAALALLAETLDLTPNVVTDRATVPLDGYAATAGGYRFSYELSAPTRLLIPVAAHDGARITLDGITPLAPQTIEAMLAIDAPAGRHEIDIAYASPARFGAGWLVSLAAVVGLVALCRGRRRPDGEARP